MYSSVTQAINQEASTHVCQVISEDERNSGGRVARVCVQGRWWGGEATWETLSKRRITLNWATLAWPYKDMGSAVGCRLAAPALAYDHLAVSVHLKVIWGCFLFLKLYRYCTNRYIDQIHWRSSSGCVVWGGTFNYLDISLEFSVHRLNYSI